ncbi:lysozyme g [Larimichthys crocea]|uniref:lysozyme g n=1 Tax=Larimichthys crocea TaxID=215358 RepID=UPI000900BCF0|nr:lysozyme g [Larimichthys crocea]
MPAKTPKDALTNMLEDLSDRDLEKFRYKLLDRREKPRIRTRALEGKNDLEIAAVMVSTFTEKGAIKVALEVLENIGCNAARESLDKETLIDSTYGDIMEVKTSGASAQTAQQDKLKYEGVEASHAMAETDLREMEKYKTIIKNVAREKEIAAALIAAIISRSCRGGRALKEGKGRYDEQCFGLMQIHEVHEPKGSWNSEEHLSQGTDILIYFITRIKNAFPEWTKEQQLKGGIAAYSAGEDNIKCYEAVDARTPCGDYSNDVVARAQWYKIHGGF